MASFGSHSVFAVVLILVLAGGQAVAAGPPGEVRVGAFIGTAISEHDDLNTTISDWGTQYREGMDGLGIADADFGEDEMGEGMVFGGHAEYVGTGNFGICAEFTPLSSKGGFDYAFSHDSDPVFSGRGEAEYKASAYLISVSGIYLIPVGDSPLALRLGAGAGYLFGARITVEAEQVYTDNTTGTERWYPSLKASGSAVAFQGFAGAEFRVTDGLLLCANAAYRAASVDELEVDEAYGESASWFGDLRQGGTLKWHSYELGGGASASEFSTEEGSNIGLDFSGFYLTVSVAYPFGL